MRTFLILIHTPSGEKGVVMTASAFSISSLSYDELKRRLDVEGCLQSQMRQMLPDASDIIIAILENSDPGKQTSAIGGHCARSGSGVPEFSGTRDGSSHS